MNTVLLQYALEVEKTGSITKAANNLYMEQPNLSKAIKSLEETLGAPVFKRSPRGVIPTAKGKLFLEHARKVLEQIEQMEDVYKNQAEREMQFRISIPRATYLSEAFSRFTENLDGRQGMSLWLRETNSIETMEEVSDGTCQLGIIRYPVSLEHYYAQMLQEKELCGKVIWEYSPLLLMSERHPLAEKETVSYVDLQGYVEILHGDIKLPEEPGTGKRKQPHRRIYVFERGSQIHLLQTNPDTYMWVSALPKRCLRQNSLVQKPCMDKEEVYRDVCIFRQNYEWSAYDKLFMEQVHSVKQELIRANGGGKDGRNC